MTKQFAEGQKRLQEGVLTGQLSETLGRSIIAAAAMLAPLE
jgi:hypothetical protein